MPEVASRVLRNRKKNRRTTTDENQQPPIASLRLHATCVTLALMAAGIFTLVEHDDHQHTIWCVFEITMQTCIVVMATAYFRLRVSVMRETSFISPLLVMVASLSLICEPIQRLMFGTGHAFEILIMHSQCNLMLALAVCGFRIPMQRLSVIIAVFMTIFCCTISNGRGLVPAAAVFTITAIVWLVMAWWESVDRRLLESSGAALPWKWLGLAGALPIVAFTVASGFGSNTLTTALQGFMPSSGGTGEYSPYSRGGVNDGDAVIAGSENIKSFAPLEDAPFVDSELPSLYDVFNDTYDEPARKIKNQDRAIALPPELMKHVHQQMAESKQAGREFSLMRSQKEADNERIRSLDSKAVFYVAGRTPLHLKLETFEILDGLKWYPTERLEIDQPLRNQETDGEADWFLMPSRRSSDIFLGTAEHSIKVANLDGNTLPIPPHLIGFSIDKVDRASMYRAFRNGTIRLNRTSVPPMIPINYVSRCVDYEFIPESTELSFLPRGSVRTMQDIYVQAPSHEATERIRTLARKITFGLERGWLQIDAVTQYLRNEFVLDRDVHASPETDSPVDEFLFETQRGPEYMFASAAAYMLRSLGYPCRLASGFYASPKNYDSRKQHTIVYARDAHFWVEVAIGSDSWLTVEPSPGYELLAPPPGVWDITVEMFHVAWAFAVRNAIVLTLLSILAIAAMTYRRTLVDWWLTVRWKLTAQKFSQRRAVRLAALVDKRLRLAGLERQTGTTLRRWAGQEILEPVRNDLVRVADIANAAAFGPETTTIDDQELERLETGLSFRTLRQLRKQVTHINSDRNLEIGALVS